MITKEQIERLEQLEKAATPGPWEKIGTSVVDWKSDHTFTMEFLPNRWSEKQDDDAELIAEIRNAAAPLLSSAKKLLAIRAECESYSESSGAIVDLVLKIIGE